MAGQVTRGQPKPGKALGFILVWGEGRGAMVRLAPRTVWGTGWEAAVVMVPRSPPSALAISIALATMAPRGGQNPAAVEGATAHVSSFQACKAAFVCSLGRQMARGGLPCPSLKSRHFTHPDPGWPVGCED